MSSGSGQSPGEARPGGSSIKSRNLAKQAGFQLIAGGSAGIVEVSIMHPLDLVKTRFQLQSVAKGAAAGAPAGHHEVHHYSGIADCFRKMYRQEGLRSFWKGVLPPIMVETPKRAFKTYSAAGLASGLSEAVIVNPFEAVKVRMQSDRAHHSEAPSTSSVFRQISREEGLFNGVLRKGLTATMARNGAFNMIYFGFYHSVKDFVPQLSDPKGEFLRKLTIGLMAGSLASIFNIPFDVAKSRIQGPQPASGQPPYRGTLKTIIRIYKSEGPLALYKGLLPKVLRLGPGGAIMLLVYEHVYDLLKEACPD